jgi:hypothetical protein
MNQAATLGLAPPGPFSDEWAETWFQDLFSNELDERPNQPSVIVQGGEAVNFYSTYKYENVPTHDTDTRVLIGNHFTYLTSLADVPMAMRRKMHKFRFFLAFILHAALNDFFYKTAENPDEADTEKANAYKQAFGIDADATFELNITIGRDSFDELILNQTYDINNDEHLATLIALDVMIRKAGVEIDCGLVDLFVPYKTDPADRPYFRVGQSDNIHSYFATDQARELAVPPSVVPNPAGHVPSFDQLVTISDSVPYISGKVIDIRLVPLGFILFETLRMLHVSAVFKAKQYANQKLEKYKQKLNVLLATLLSADLSATLFEMCQTKKSRNEDTGRLLVGGRVPETNTSQYKIEPLPIVERKQTNTSMTPILPTTQTEETKSKEQQAREYSRSIKKDAEPDPETLSEVEWLGYMDYLSYLHPDFKVYRLPLLPVDFEERKNTIYKSPGQRTPSVVPKKGGYRHSTQKKQKKNKSKRTTQRK